MWFHHCTIVQPQYIFLQGNCSLLSSVLFPRCLLSCQGWFEVVSVACAKLVCHSHFYLFNLLWSHFHVTAHEAFVPVWYVKMKDVSKGLWILSQFSSSWTLRDQIKHWRIPTARENVYAWNNNFTVSGTCVCWPAHQINLCDCSFKTFIIHHPEPTHMHPFRFFPLRNSCGGLH